MIVAVAAASASSGLWLLKLWGWVSAWVALVLFVLALVLALDVVPPSVVSPTLAVVAESVVPQAFARLGLLPASLLLLPIILALRRAVPTLQMTSPATSHDSPPTIPIWRRLVLCAGVEIILVVPIGLALPAPPWSQIRESPLPGKRLRVLFVGNSQVFVNDVPGMLLALGAAAQPPQGISVGMVVGGGYSLHLHLSQGMAADVIEGQGPWDYVVLQEQSSTPTLFPEEMQRSLRRFDPMIRHAGARTVILATWLRPFHRDRFAQHQEAFVAIGQELSAPIVLANRAWEEVLQTHPELELYHPDQVHALPAGSYLAACTLYASLCGRNPEGLPATLRDPGGQLLVELPALQARWLQAAAWRAAQVSDR